LLDYSEKNQLATESTESTERFFMFLSLACWTGRENNLAWLPIVHDPLIGHGNTRNNTEKGLKLAKSIYPRQIEASAPYA
jgi:hypothetical protein